MSQKVMKKRKSMKGPNVMFQSTDESQKYDDTEDAREELDGGESYLYRTRSTFYSTVSLWDILIDCSNVTEKVEDNSSPSLNEKRVSSMICNLDELLSKFNEFILEVCSSSNQDDLDIDSSNSTSDNATDNSHSKCNIKFTENLSSIMKHDNRQIQLINEKQLESEFEKCGMIIDSVFEHFVLDETEKTSNIYTSPVDGIEQNENKIHHKNQQNLCIKDEEALASYQSVWDNEETDDMSDVLSSDIALNSEEISLDTEMTINEEMNIIYPNRRSKKRSNKAGRPKGSKMKPSDSMVGRFRRLGYYPDYCVSEEVYNDAIEKGSPYCCPLCQKAYKERRSLEKHFAGTVNNKCPGVPVEKPTYKLENGRYYCTQSGCEHEVATLGAKSMGVIWTHHQSEHLSKDSNLPFNCDQCPKSFPLHSILASHIASTHELKKCSQICDVCGKTIAGSKNKIKQHMLVHTGEKIKCTQCDITFSRPGSLRRHMQHQHNASKFQLHFCDVCGKGWKTRSGLNIHLESHQTQPDLQQQQTECMMQTYSQENG